MIPRLFEYAYRPNLDGGFDCNIDSNGIGPLTDSVSCDVKEGTDGTYQLSLKYPVGGLHWNELDVARVIACRPNDYSRVQPFVIKSISKPFRGTVDISADHISYDASGVMVQGFSAPNTIFFKENLANSAIDSPFVFDTDILKEGLHKGFNCPPRSLRMLLLDKKAKDSFISLYGGEFSFDRLEIFAHEHRGSNRGVRIKYGKNLMSLVQTRNIRDFATACYPYWYKPDSPGGSYVELPEKVLQYEVAEYSDVQKTIPVNLSSEFKTAPTIEELRQAAADWINSHWEEAPPDNIKLSFIELAKTTEYKDLLTAEDVRLYDTITVDVPHMNLCKQMKVIKVTYDVLNERYSSIEIGSPIDSLEDTILKLGGSNE